MKNLYLFLAACFFMSQSRSQNYSLNFNGSSQYVNIPDQNSLDLSTNFSIEGWVYPTGPGSQPTEGGIIVNKEASYEIARFADGTLQYALSANGTGSDWWGWINTGLVLPLNTWSHFAFIKTGAAVTIYLNGAATYSSVGNPVTLVANTLPLRIGNRSTGSAFFNGAVDEFRIWNTTKTLAEIKANMFNRNLSNTATGLVGYYRMNENTGTTTANSSTNTSGIDGTLIGSPTWVASPIKYAANALSFDGTDDAVTIADDISLRITTMITIEALVYATKSTGIQNVVSKSSTTTNMGYIFPRTDDGWVNAIGYLYIGGGWQTLSAPYGTLNAWHHLALTYDGVSMKLYIDGVLKNSKAQTGLIASNGNPLALGNQTGFTENFGGGLDEVRIWNVVRTQAEIQSKMNVELDPATQTGLVSYYHFNQGNTAGVNAGLLTIMDAKGNNNGTMANFGSSGATSNFIAQNATLTLLPVSWLGFTAQKQDNKVLLNWSTASEQNTRGFIVQQSINAVDWNSIGNLQATGNSSTVQQYSFVHSNPNNGINYYRIQLQDIDGKISFSKVISINYSNQPRKMSIYPNPVTDGVLHIQLQEAATVFIYNNDGKLTMSKKLTAGTQQVSMGRFAKGVYQVKAGEETVQVVVQ